MTVSKAKGTILHQNLEDFNGSETHEIILDIPHKSLSKNSVSLLFNIPEINIESHELLVLKDAINSLVCLLDLGGTFQFDSFNDTVALMLKDAYVLKNLLEYSNQARGL